MDMPSPALRDTDGQSSASAVVDVLRIVTCGSVDHGKSSVLGRLLFEAKAIPEDQLRALEADSRNRGVEGGLDYALLFDGLEAEREQGITIDVAYRYFSVRGRRFILADSPGHEQYTRNMATAASTADLALIVVDASLGLMPQTKRHTYIFALLGVRSVLLVVNKMDLIDYDEQRFVAIADAYSGLAREVGLEAVQCIPVSALKGDNIAVRSANTAWYARSTLLEYLTTTLPAEEASYGPFRLPVQRVVRPSAAFRGYSGLVCSGTIAVGDAVSIQPSGRATRIATIFSADGEAQSAGTGKAVTVTLADEIDISRGDLICAGAAPLVADQFAAHLIWMDERPLLPGRQYLMKSGTRTVRAAVSTLKHRVNINTFEAQSATSLHLNEIGYVNVTTDRLVAVDPYKKLRETGSFILIDPTDNQTVGAGIIEFELRRANNVRWQDLQIGKDVRARLNHQRPCVLWFTGLSGAGKSTIADIVEKRLVDMGRHTYLLDGDNLRHGLNKDLGFTAEARVENVRRVVEVARLFVDAGLIVMASLISPFRAERDMARSLLGEGEFIEIHVATSLEICEQRDPKGLYRRARAGEIPNFTGIGSPYEPPGSPELVLTPNDPATVSADRIIEYLRRNAYI